MSQKQGFYECLWVLNVRKEPYDSVRVVYQTNFW